MKCKISRLNWQGNAARSEYGKILPGEQPIRFQNSRSETPCFTWLYKVLSRSTVNQTDFDKTGQEELPLYSNRYLTELGRHQRIRCVRQCDLTGFMAEFPSGFEKSFISCCVLVEFTLSLHFFLATCRSLSQFLVNPRTC